MNKKAFIPISALMGALLLALFAAMTPFVAEPERAYAQTATIEFAENGTGAVATFTAEDPEGATPIAWDLVAGGGDPDGAGDLEATDNVDSDDFTIDKDGMLKFSSPPDFENPADSDTDNTYNVVVVACDVALVSDACPASPDGQAGYHKVTVKVTKVDEPGKVTVATNTANGTPQYLVGATLTATAEDGDITNATQTFTADVADEVNGVTWRWYRGGTEITGADAQDNTYTLLSTDAGQHIRVVVYYIVDGNVDQEMASFTTDYPVLAARVGANQLEFDPATVSMSISEGAKDRNVGTPVTAMGNHGTVRYSLTDAGDSTTASPRFKIDEKTGQITTTVELDYEGEAAATADAAGSCADATSGTPDRVCTVVVTAFDSTGEALTNTATVTIMITDVDDEPAFSTGAQMVGVPENSTALWHGSTAGYTATTEAEVTYTAMDPEGRTVNYSLAGPDASMFQISGDPPVLSFVSAPDFEAKASTDGDNVYEVTVQASVGGDTGERMVRVTVRNVDEGPMIMGVDSVTYAENGEGTVATFTAMDPEGATSITWSLATDTSIDGVETPDVADNAEFTIDEDGMLKFSSPPDFENPAATNATDNTYKVVVLATDAATGGQTGYHKVTVMVTKVSEPGKVTVTTSTANGTPQYLVGATLTATAEDGDITNATQTFTADVTDEVDGVHLALVQRGSSHHRCGNQHLPAPTTRCGPAHPRGGSIPG